MIAALLCCMSLRAWAIELDVIPIRDDRRDRRRGHEQALSICDDCTAKLQWELDEDTALVAWDYVDGTFGFHSFFL